MKRNYKVLISLLLAMVILTMSMTTAFAAMPEYGEEYISQPTKTNSKTFTDVKESYWAYQYISEMVNRGVLSGYPNGYFYPDNTITRAEFSKIMCLAASIKVAPVSATSYVDVATDDWFAPYVEAGRYYLSGYISDGNKYYMPNDNALREDIAVALVKLKGYDTSLYDESILKAMFTDYQSISSGARKYVSVAVEQGLISGYEDNTFRGQNTITRAEAATLLWRAYQYGSGNKVFEKEDFEEPVTSTTKTDTKETSTTNTTTKTDTITNEEDKLKLTLDVDKTNFDVEAGDTVKFTVTIGFNFLSKSSDGETREGYLPYISDDSDIMTSIWGDSRKTSENKTISEYSTKELKPGKYTLNISVVDEYTTHEKIITINVTEPEPEYLYELKTIASSVSNVDGMVATDDGIVYLDKDKIMEVKKDANKATCIFEASDIGYLGTEELTKFQKEGLKLTIRAIGYNQNDNCVYAIVTQPYDNYQGYLYNVTEKSSRVLTSEKIFDETGSYKNVIYLLNQTKQFIFDNSNNVRIFSLTISETGIISSHQNSNMYSAYINNEYYTIYDTNISKMNKSGDFDNIDCYVPGNPKFFAVNNKNFYFTSKNELYTVDTNGDYKLLCGIGDIDNADGKSVRIDNIKCNTSAVDNDGVIYYWDIDYKCIRQLEHK